MDLRPGSGHCPQNNPRCAAPIWWKPAASVMSGGPSSTDDFTFGQPLLNSHLVSLLDEPLYFSDGQIKDEVYVYASFRQSKMYLAGVTCVATVMILIPPGFWLKTTHSATAATFMKNTG